MNEVLLNSALILLFICIGGVFAAAEMSLVSLRESQIRALGKRGKRGRTIATLTEDPNRFLSAVQIGVTLSGFLSAAFGGATLASALSPVLERIGLSEAAAATVALVAITVLISYVSIVLGELTAKRLALQRSEAFALGLAPIINVIATLARPVIWLLGVSTNVAVRVLGGDPHANRDEVTDEEIRAMVSGSTTLGDQERQIVDDVFAAGGRGLRDVMVPRTEASFLHGDTPIRETARAIAGEPHSRYPVTGESADDVLGFVHIRDVLAPEVVDRDLPLSNLVRPISALPDTVNVLSALNRLRNERGHIAIVVDEYGGTAGIVTIEDLIEELVGDIMDEYDLAPDEPSDATGGGDPTVFDGLTTLDEFTERVGRPLPKGRYHTVAGFLMAEAGALPEVGTEVVVELVDPDLPEDEESDSEAEQWRFTVTEMDGRRIAELRAEQVPAAAGAAVVTEEAAGTADPTA
ncbi:hemolysin family protein [Propionibacteriaceae bacterium Y2011]